jgi:hypothetical protein
MAIRDIALPDQMRDPSCATRQAGLWAPGRTQRGTAPVLASAGSQWCTSTSVGTRQAPRTCRTCSGETVRSCVTTACCTPAGTRPRTSGRTSTCARQAFSSTVHRKLRAHGDASLRRSGTGVAPPSFPRRCSPWQSQRTFAGRCTISASQTCTSCSPRVIWPASFLRSGRSGSRTGARLPSPSFWLRYGSRPTRRVGL